MTYKPLGGIVIAVAINKLQVEVEVEPSPIGPNPPTAKRLFWRQNKKSRIGLGLALGWTHIGVFLLKEWPNVGTDLITWKNTLRGNRSNLLQGSTRNRTRT